MIWRFEPGAFPCTVPAPLADLSDAHERSLQSLRLALASNAELIELVRAIPNRTKHGPGGKGGNGPCDADCLKCRAMSWLARNDVKL